MRIKWVRSLLSHFEYVSDTELEKNINEKKKRNVENIPLCVEVKNQIAMVNVKCDSIKIRKMKS